MNGPNLPISFELFKTFSRVVNKVIFKVKHSSHSKMSESRKIEIKNYPILKRIYLTDS